MKQKSRFVLGLVLLAPLTSLKSFADIPPAPTPPQPIPQPTAAAGPQKYQLQLEAGFSSALLNSVNFQSTTTVPINNSTGQCNAQQKSWSSGEQAIVCRSTTSCTSTDPVCVLTFPTTGGYGPSNFVTILGATATTGSSGPNG
jgi:hypothetical protein